MMVRKLAAVYLDEKHARGSYENDELSCGIAQI